MAWTARDFVGGVLALDFANAVGDSTERLADVDDLLGWVSFAGVANQVATLRFRSDLHGDRKRAEALLRHARDVRGILRGVGTAMAQGMEPPKGELIRLRDVVAEVVKDAEFSPDLNGSYRLSFENGSAEIAILGPVVWSAVEMLGQGQFERVKQCPKCGFLFFDRSKNNSRRWCDMAACGNRTKLQNFRERRR